MPAQFDWERGFNRNLVLGKLKKLENPTVDRSMRANIRESFYRLSPIRIVAMHSRVVTLDDELLLNVESRRVLKAIGKI